MIIIAIFFHGRGGKGGPGVKPPENLQNLAILSSGNALFDIEKALQNGHSCSFAEKGRGLGPQDSPLILRLQ